MKEYAYVGSRKKLKPLGWKFNRLFARNYLTYNKANIWMFVVSKMVLEIEHVKRKDQQAVIEFILKHPEKPLDFWEPLQTSPQMIKVFGPKSRSPAYVVYQGKVIPKAEHRALIGGPSNPEFFRTPFFIVYELVQAVLELAAAGKLELIETRDPA